MSSVCVTEALNFIAQHIKSSYYTEYQWYVMWLDTRRPHSWLGRLTPIEAETGRRLHAASLSLVS